MQSNVKQTEIPTALPVQTLAMIKEVVGDLSIDEAIALHDEYQSDRITTVCPCCSRELYDDQLLLVTTDHPTATNPGEWHNECPSCNSVVAASDLQKPHFELWLKFTA